MNYVTTFAPFEKLDFVSQFELDKTITKFKKNSRRKSKNGFSDYGQVIIYHGADDGRKVLLEEESDRLTIPGRDGRTILLERRGQKMTRDKLEVIIKSMNRHNMPFLDKPSGPLGPYRRYDLGRGSYLLYEKHFERITLYTYDEQEAQSRKKEFGIMN